MVGHHQLDIKLTLFATARPVDKFSGVKNVYQRLTCREGDEQKETMKRQRKLVLLIEVALQLLSITL